MPTTSASRVIAAPQQEIWATLADVTNASRWNGAWSQIEFTSSQREGVGTSFRAHADGRPFEFEITHWTPPEHIAFAPVRGDDSERYPINLESHAFRLQPADDHHTNVEIIAIASMRGIRGRLIGLFLWRGYQKRGLYSALDALQAIFEPPEEDDISEPEETPSSSPD